MNGKFCTPKEVADALRVHVATVRRWLKDGQLEGQHIGRQWRIPESEVERVRKDGLAELPRR